MAALHLLSYFFGGAFVTNAVPHFVSGVMGRPFQSPFAKPPGQGLSSSTVNVLWGFLNLIAGYLLLCRVGDFDLKDTREVTALALGVLLMGLMGARHFGRLHGGNMPVLAATLFAALAALPMTGVAQTPKTAAIRAVLVTGASSGIGLKITERLAADGYLVYAGARKDTDLQRLSAIRNVQPLRLDVTKQADIDAAVAVVTKAGRGLYGIVNNAGIVTIGSVLDTKMEEFDAVMAVNVYGPWRITRAFAPLIIASKGRITNIGSLNGIVASPQASAYSMSKHAIEAFTDALAAEMAPLGVQVNVVEPGSYKSNIAKNALQRSGTGGQFVESVAHEQDPDAVAAAVEQALFARAPKHRYMVVPNREQAEMTIKTQIDRLVQLNEGQPYAYDRAALVKMLDVALSKSH
jgi:NAD(P)-dependent dehydrogenase (short-subunit alcohol dehydrogenase family)